MTTADLALAITRHPGFEWRAGMVCRPAPVLGQELGTLVLHNGSFTAMAEVLNKASLDLNHDANTGFLLQMLWASGQADIRMGRRSGRLVTQVVTHAFQQSPLPNQVHEADGEHINHALARAILGAGG